MTELTLIIGVLLWCSIGAATGRYLVIELNEKYKLKWSSGDMVFVIVLAVLGPPGSLGAMIARKIAFK